MSEKIFDLKDFDKYREDNRREVKKAKGGLPVSLWDSYSSMCNTYGGVIICGVQEREDGSWHTTGLKYEDVSKLKKSFWDSINDRKKVSISLLSESDVVDYKVGDDLVLVIYVPRADRESRPVYINDNLMGGTFKRNWEGDYHCTLREVKAMLRDQAEESPDMKVLEDQDMEDLDYDSIKIYRSTYNAYHSSGAWQKLSDDEFLVKLGAASKKTRDGKIHPTAAGLLMFGQEYLIMTEFPEYFLDFREKLDPNIRWTDRVQTQSGDFSGNVYDFYRIVYRKLVTDFKVPFQLKDGVRVEETPKHKAVREALANALVNTDYFQSWSVVIEHYPDKIVMANPGTIIPGKEQMLRGGISQPRNKVLFKMFNMIGVGEHAGSGVPDIFDVWETEGLLEPTIEEQFGAKVPDRTILTLPLTAKEQVSPLFEKGAKKSAKTGAKKSEEVAERVEKVYAAICNNPYVKNSELEILVGASKRQIENAVKSLRNDGRIHREDNNRKGKWIINQE